MNIIVGKTAGFCYGVKRAVDNTKEELNKIGKEEKLNCLGELVHNNDVNSSLKSLGLTYIEDIKNSNGINTIIRAHGVKKEVYEYAEKNNIKLIDLTCPNVLRIHKIAEDYSNRGFFIFLTGSKAHPENIGTASYCGNNYYVIEDIDKTEEGIEILKKSGIKDVLLISQTTFDLEKFYLIREKISYNLSKEYNFEIENTICNATEQRQKEVANIAKNVECMIIIGGKNSSNTKKLYNIALNYCKNVYLIENEKELDKKEITKYENVGIMAGASTPQNSINNVLKKIKGE